ncbi:hypothetical protein IMY05_C0771000400 [Salix suchowensis]|nr:hypothetical protein IMY05_C0771000400 [Salix suchowensis]
MEYPSLGTNVRHPPHLQLPPLPERQVAFLVPKFHLPAHITACQTSFSFNYTPGVGRTDGEAPERGWDFLNPAAGQTKEMGPGARRELLEDLMGDRNWKKTVGLGKTLLRRIKTAVATCAEQIDSHSDFEKRLGPTVVGPWRTAVEAWEADSTKPNPFASAVKTMSQHAVRLELNEEEALLLAQGKLELFHEDVTPCVLISTGLDLEEQQWRRKLEFTVSRPGRRRANDEFVATFEPGPRTTCPTNLREIEWKLRFAQAQDALNHIRASLQIRAGVFQQKDRFERGQRAMTRSRSVIARLQDKIDDCAERYRVARRALAALAPILNKSHESWATSLQELRDGDIRAISAGEIRETEGRRTMSWIWRVEGVAETAALRVEWCKSRARAMRWSEEVELLEEEMRRVLAFLDWKAAQWDTRAVLDGGMRTDITRGAQAYAKRQASIMRSLTREFRRTWASVPMLMSLHEPYKVFSDWDANNVDTTSPYIEVQELQKSGKLPNKCLSASTPITDTAGRGAVLLVSQGPPMGEAVEDATDAIKNAAAQPCVSELAGEHRRGPFPAAAIGSPMGWPKGESFAPRSRMLLKSAYFIETRQSPPWRPRNSERPGGPDKKQGNPAPGRVCRQ